MGYIEVTDEAFPDDVLAIGITEMCVVVRCTDNVTFVWPWQQALKFAVELGGMAGKASVRDDAHWSAVADAMEYTP